MRFLTRPGCHLCEEAFPLVKAAVARSGMVLEVVDIETDEEILGRFGLRIPVVLRSDGTVAVEGIITSEAQVLAALRRDKPR